MLEKLKKIYPPGTRILLHSMFDKYGQALLPGSTGTVTMVDDIGQIHMKWDNGSTLPIVPEEDFFEKISEAK